MDKTLLVVLFLILFILGCFIIKKQTQYECFTDSTELATVVTAFYPAKSKRSPEQYLEWATTFMKLSAPIVLFTDEQYAYRFKDMRTNGKPLKVITRPFSDFYTWNAYQQTWIEHHKMDHEEVYHSPELYAIWSQKPFFLAEIAKTNPFNTDTFYWCDIGAFRDSNISSSLLSSFPRADILHSVSPAILMSSVKSLEPSDKIQKADGIYGDFQYTDRIVGGLWGGTKEACMRWKNAYESQLRKYISANRFAGKEQSIMNSMVVEDPTLAVVVNPTDSGDPWFFQQKLLSSASARFEKDVSYSR